MVWCAVMKVCVCVCVGRGMGFRVGVACLFVELVVMDEFGGEGFGVRVLGWDGTGMNGV